MPEERIEEFHLFAQDFNSLLGKWRTDSASCRKNAQLLRSSLHDPLTGLANCAAFRNALAELMQSIVVDHRSSALLFLDGDNFKLINDNWGHTAGDKEC